MIAGWILIGCQCLYRSSFINPHIITLDVFILFNFILSHLLLHSCWQTGQVHISVSTVFQGLHPWTHQTTEQINLKTWTHQPLKLHTLVCFVKWYCSWNPHYQVACYSNIGSLFCYQTKSKGYYTTRYKSKDYPQKNCVSMDINH